MGQKDELTKDLQYNLQEIQETMGNSSDLATRELRFGRDWKILAGIIYIEGLTDKVVIQDNIIKPLIEDTGEIDLDDKKGGDQQLVQRICQSVLLVGKSKVVNNFETLIASLLSGDTIILFDGHAWGIISDTKGLKDRGVSEPSTQTVIRGPRDSFSETLRTNTSLIRRRIKDSRLRLETKQIGRVTQTDVSIMYIQGIANDQVVEEVRLRLNRIDIDAILESGYIEELIQDETYTPFPTMFHAERPDVISAGILEGRVAVLIDGTPFVLLAPALFIQFFQSAEDYYQRADISTLVRLLRLMAFMISLIGPSAYIAITTFHQEMIPTQLLISLAASREGVPFPAFVEAL
ncbi:MAG TPA: spore germination protein, partial [Bacilli bacterium]